MSSERRIEINFEETLKQANRLDELSSNLIHQVTEGMEESMQTLAVGWKSESTGAFLTKERSVKDEIRSTADLMAQVAQDIRDVAEAIYEAEMENLERARNRDS